MALRNIYRLSVYDSDGYWCSETFKSVDNLRARIIKLTAEGYDLVVRFYGSRSLHVRTFEHVTNN